MRILSVVILTITAVWTAEPARAQTYDPDYPVCLHVFRPWEYFQCAYTSLAQCAPAASGRGAMCIVNPYFAGPQRKPHRRQRIY